MKVRIYFNRSEPHRVDKTLIDLGEVEVYMRDASSIIDPVFLFEMDSPVVTRDGVDYMLNYLYVPSFNRYYYVTNVSVNRTRLWQFQCHCDVLSSFKEEWKSLPVIIARNEFQYNLFLQDDRFLVNANRFVQTLVFPNTAQIDTTGGSSYIITIAGGEKEESEATT